MESFFGRLKTECYFGRRFTTFAELEQSIHEYIHYYNNECIQIKLKGLSPVQYRTSVLELNQPTFLGAEHFHPHIFYFLCNLISLTHLSVIRLPSSEEPKRSKS